MIIEAVILIASVISVYVLITTESSINEYMRSEEHLEYSTKRRERLENDRY